MYIPDGGVFLALLIAPTIAGLLTGLSGAGSAIMIQVCFRLFSSLLGIDIGEGDTSVASRRILAIASVLSLTQYPVSAWQLYRTPSRQIRWDIVAFIFPGLNILVWVGTWIAMYFKPDILVFSLGVVFILIAGWQFYHQSVMGRKVDDDQIRSAARARLNRKMSQQNLTLDAVSISANSSMYQKGDSAGQNGTTAGTDLADLGSLGEVEPKLPKRLKIPDPSFDLQAYGTKTGLDFTVNKEENSVKKNIDSAPYGSDGDVQSITVSDSSVDPSDEFEMITGTLAHVDNRPWHQRIIEQAKSWEGTLGLICGAVSGLLGGMFATNGPPIFVYVAYLKLNAQAIRDTCVVIFLANLPCLILARIVFNVYHVDEILIYCIAIVMSTLGLFIGWYLHPYCDTRIITSLLQLIILLASIPLTSPGTAEVVNIVFLILYLIIACALCGFMVWRISRNNQIREQVKQQFYTLNGGAPTK